MDGRIEFRGHDFDLLNKGDEEPSAELIEGLFILQFENSDLSVGKQIITWGRADGINPTDNLSSKDFTIILPEESDRKSGVTGLKYDYYLTNEFTATIFYSPFFKPNELPFAFPPFIHAYENSPTHKIENSQVGVRLNKIGNSDWSISYYNGFDLAPEIRLNSSGNGITSISIENHRMQVFGADFAKNFGRYGLRGEAAYILTEDMAGNRPDINNPNIFYVIGADRTFIETLNINLQLIGRHIFQFSDYRDIKNPIERSLYGNNAIFSNELDEDQYSMSCRIDYKLLNETLDLEIFGVYNLIRNDYLLRPFIRYAIIDSLKGTIGGELYEGKEDTLYGMFEDNNTYFVELKYSF
jgi:hypothetical protein